MTERDKVYRMKLAEQLGYDPDAEEPAVVTYLYRHFSEDGTLLYVGISSDWLQRLIQHSRESEWYGEIASVTIEKFESREEAREVEEAEIRSECPPYNKTW